MRQFNTNLLYEDASLPKRATKLASGFDLCAYDVITPNQLGSTVNKDFRSYALLPNERVLVRTGVAIELEEGYEAQVRPRSGLSIKSGIVAILGTIDADYTGEIGVILINKSNKPFIIEKGDRVAQLVIAPVSHDIELVPANKIKKTKRGSNGYGSTGVKKKGE